MERILVVDDEPANTEMLSDQLKSAGYRVDAVNSGHAGWTKLQEGETFDVILVDYMMPEMNGIQLLKRIKADPKLCGTPVIIQTAVTETTAILEGIASGAYNYLFKPYQHELLLSLVRAAIADATFRQSVNEQICNYGLCQSLLSEATYEFKTLKEARCVAHCIARSLESPYRMSGAVFELFINAIEHGNLGITFEEKKELLIAGEWENEIERRLNQVPYKNRVVRVQIKKAGDELIIHICDEGPGFDPAPFLHLGPGRLAGPNGRGLVMAHVVLPQLTFLGKGNEVIFSCRIQNSLDAVHYNPLGTA